MQPKWHVAFCNITITEYAGVTFKAYCSDPAVMLESQLRAKEIAEKRFGCSAFVNPYIDGPNGTIATLFGMRIIYPEKDELPYLDASSPPIADAAEAHKLRLGDPEKDGLIAERLRTWRYNRNADIRSCRAAEKVL